MPIRSSVICSAIGAAAAAAIPSFARAAATVGKRDGYAAKTL